MVQRVTSQVASVLIACIGASALLASAAERTLSETELEAHLDGIAARAKAAPMVVIPDGPFLLGTNRIDDDPYGLATQFDNTELPQREVWLDAYAIDQYEVSLAEYLAFLIRRGLQPPQELKALIEHLITIHYMPDYVMAGWPAMYVSWEEAAAFCRAHGKRLPSEAEWEKAARGTDGRVFPWGDAPPAPGIAVFDQHHVHEIPLVAAVNGVEEGRSPYGLHHMAGNVSEWVQDWFGFDYYAIMPDRNPPGPSTGRYKAVRGGSWRSRAEILRTASRNGASPDQRAPTLGFRCARGKD